MNNKFSFKIGILLCLSVVICSSCRCLITPQYVKEYFNYCYDGAYTGIDTLINIEGYYSHHHSDSPRLMFYKDGICINGFGVGVWGGKTVQTQFEEVVNNPRELKAFHRSGSWGCYIISGDTIKIRTVRRPVCGSTDITWRLEVERYKIIDKNTLERIYPPASVGNQWAPTKFYPLTVRPNSDCSLKKKKWFWCNKEQYKEYKRTLKQSRK